MAAPPLGFPMPNLDLVEVMADEYGMTYHDQRGYLWRGPEFRPRFDQLKAADPTFNGGWQSIGSSWFRSRKVSAEYAPSLLDQVIKSADPAVDAVTSIGTKVLIGAVAYGGFKVMQARGWKF